MQADSMASVRSASSMSAPFAFNWAFLLLSGYEASAAGYVTAY
jgi:hypothetical protein